jgi:predicted AlkP superfamily phosphohydrolase/phosphomutase
MADPSRSGTKERVLFIGWDAADAELLDRWCAGGLLPNVARMRSLGASARMGTTADVFHVSAWPSLFTGTTPDKHGLYHAYVTIPGHQGLLRPRPDSTPFPFLWKLLSDRGKRCVVIDAFLTCPLQGLNGVQIVDWGSWSWFWEPTFVPSGLKAEVRRKFGPYPAEDHSKVGVVPLADFNGFRTRLLAGVQTKTDVVKWLMAKEDWDLLLVVFGESHPAGHYFWQFHDPTFPAYPKTDAGPLRHALLDIYVALDRALGELLQAAGGGTTVFLVSGDGMGPNYSGSHILPDMLGRMGVLNTGAGRPAGAASGSDASGASGGSLLAAVRSRIPKGLRAAVSNVLLSRAQQEKLSLHFKTAGIAWNQTRAYQIENAQEGYIRVNLKGREPAGIVEAGKDYDAICDELARTMEGLINPANGQRAATAVYTTHALYHGPCRAHLPDVVVSWNMGAKLTTELRAERYGVARSVAPSWELAPYYTGNHHPHAFAVAIGPDVPRAARLDGMHILDLAPTILRRYGIDPPEYMDGQVLSALGGSSS